MPITVQKKVLYPVTTKIIVEPRIDLYQGSFYESINRFQFLYQSYSNDVPGTGYQIATEEIKGCIYLIYTQYLDFLILIV